MIFEYGETLVCQQGKKAQAGRVQSQSFEEEISIQMNSEEGFVHVFLLRSAGIFSMCS